MKKVSLLALALSTTMATFASAQAPMPVPAAPGAAPCATACPCPKAFAGFSFGGNLGYSFVASSLKSVVAQNAVAGGALLQTTTGAYNTAMQGVDGGLIVGYLHRVGNWGFGVDFLANWASTKGQSAATYAPTAGTTLVDAYKVKLNNALDLRAVFSYVISNLVMPKIMLGWENAQYKLSAAQALTVPGVTGSPAGAGIQTKSTRLNGFLWGAGVDFLVAKNVVCGLEYTGVVLGSQKLAYTYTSGASNYVSALTMKPSVYTRLAATLKFVY